MDLHFSSCSLPRVVEAVNFLSISHICIQDFKKKQEPAVDKLKEPVLDEITTALVNRYGLKFTRQDTATLWFLCKQVTTLSP